MEEMEEELSFHRESLRLLSLREIFAHTSEREYLLSVLEGEGAWGGYLVKVLVLLVGLSTLSFSLDSVESLHAHYKHLFLGIDIFCLLFFTFEYVLRIVVAKKKVEFVVQPMSCIDLLSILPSWLNILYDSSIPRLQFFRILRLFKFLISTKKGHDSAIAFRNSWKKNSSLLIASTYLFFTTWILFSCLQHFAEFDNEAMLHCVPPTGDSNEEENGCFCGDDGCHGLNCICTPRYGSLLSSMYYTLIEFSGTYELANFHCTFGRIISVGTVIASVGIFAVPTSLFAAALSDAADVIHSSQKTNSDGDCDARSEDDGSMNGEEGTRNAIDSIILKISHHRGVYSDVITPAYTLHPYYVLFSKSLVGMSAILSILITIPDKYGYLLLAFRWIDFLCIVTFGVEHVCRVAAQGPDQSIEQLFSTLLPIADGASWIPSVVIYLGGGFVPPPFIALTVSLFRILKMERFGNGFWILYKVVHRSWGLLSVGGMATFCTLMFTSTLLFYTERDNPDPSVRQYYTSVPMSLWTTMINISGMVKIDYSIYGCVIASALCLQSIAVFAVPIGAIGSGFRDVMNALTQSIKCSSSANDSPLASNTRRNETRRLLEKKPSYGTGSEVMPAEEAARGSNSSRIKMKARVQSQWFAYFSVSITLLSAIVEVGSTCSFVQNNRLWNSWEQTIEASIIFWFTAEYICRAAAFGVSYMTSNLGLLDFLATVPWYIVQGTKGSSLGVTIDKYDGPMRFLRLMRLMRLDTYAPSLSLIDNALEDCWEGMKLAMYSFLVIWFFFNEWLFLSEHKAVNDESYHFRSALSSLQYSGMLLTGGYGDMDNLTVSGQICCCLAVLVAVGIAAVPASVLSDSFVNVLKEEAEKERAIRLRIALKTQRLFRSKHSLKDVTGVVHAVSSEEYNSGCTVRVYRHLFGLNKDSWYPTVNITLTIINLCLVILESVHEVNSLAPKAFWNISEAVCVVFISVDYLLILLTMNHNNELKRSRIGYLVSFRGVCALLSVLPFWVKLLAPFFLTSTKFLSVPHVIVGFRVLRAMRIVGLDRYIKCYYFLSAVLSKVSTILTAAGIVALIVWVGGATLFYYAELSGNASSGDTVFHSIPDSMYYCAMFLVGDWEVQDFTPFGSVLCVIMSLFGVAIFALPVGILFEGFQNAIKEQNSCS